MTEQTAVAASAANSCCKAVDNIIRAFPAWPMDQDAGFTQLRARGGFLVTAKQKFGKLTKLEITSTIGGKLRAGPVDGKNC